MSDVLQARRALQFGLFTKGAGLPSPNRVALLFAAAAVCALGAITADRAWALAAPTYYGGTVTAAITVTFKVAPAAGASVSCNLSLVSNDARGATDSSGVTATVSGSQAVCNISIHYKWALTTPTQDMMRIVWSVQGPSQYSSATYDVITMPPNGTATGPLAIAVGQ